MLLICPQLALAMPFSPTQPTVAETETTAAPATPRSYVWHGVLTLILPAVMWLLGAEGSLPLNF